MHLKLNTSASLYSPERAEKIAASLREGGEDARVTDVGNDRGFLRVDLYEDGVFVMSWNEG